MNIFGIGLPEMVLIFIVALLIFGPKKLPEVGRSLGKALKSFQDASKEFEAEFKREADRLAETVQDATLDPPTPPQLAQASSSSEVEESGVAKKEQEQV
jgi:sec-independent protein translocase protein TatA